MLPTPGMVMLVDFGQQKLEAGANSPGDTVKFRALRLNT
jgi:hypothetical protein